MHEPSSCAEVRLLLARHGMPGDRIERFVGELRDHWEDLRAAALERGLSSGDAESEADTRLGKPRQLADEAIGGLRRSSWMGRHPIVVLCLGTLFLPPLLMALVILPLLTLDEWIHFTRWGNVPRQTIAQLSVATLWILHYLSIVLAPLLISWRIWRQGLGSRWVLAALTWCTLTALLRGFDASVTERAMSSVTYGVRFPWRLDVQFAAVLSVHAIIGLALLLAMREAAKTTCEDSEPTCSKL